jgi:hypothetical protein
VQRLIRTARGFDYYGRGEARKNAGRSAGQWIRSYALSDVARRTTVDLGIHFFGVSLKLERGRIPIEDNGVRVG